MIETTKDNIHNRIKPLDGLRCIAALGVIWVHIWAFYGIPVLKAGTVDVYQIISVIGNGVDFFFVISGFCMYLMASNKDFSSGSYLIFLKKRWLRIAPAYYVAVVVYAIILVINDPSFPLWSSMILHFLFLNNVINGNNISAPFWSIGTEWHFYMILPFLILLTRRINLPAAVAAFSLLSILLFCFVNLGYLSFEWWEKQIFIRFPEFGIGIVAAYFFKQKKELPKFFRGTFGIILSLMILMAGRILKFTQLLDLFPAIAFLFKSLAFPVMTLGFALLMYHVITIDSLFSRALSGKIITYLGRISFSIYLWHSLAIMILARLLTALPFGNLNMFPAFIVVALLTILMADISYRFFESFYFRKST